MRQKDRAKILFEKYSKLREAYGLVCRLRSIFRDKMLLREEAWTKLHEWYANVAACTIREIKSVRDTIKAREEDVQNFLVNRSTNAFAKSLNSMIKGFRTRLRGVRDISFFTAHARLCEHPPLLSFSRGSHVPTISRKGNRERSPRSLLFFFHYCAMMV